MADSIEPLTRAAALAPGDAALQHDLGLTLLHCRRPVEAAAALRRAIAANPKFAAAHWRLGMSLEASGDAAGALKAYERATAIDGTLAHAHFRIAHLYELAGRRNEAGERYREASAKATEPDLRYRTIAGALLIEENDGEAEQRLREWQAVNPGHPDVNEMLGLVLSESGRHAEAAEAYRRAIAADPGRIGLYYDLVRLSKITAADQALVAAMQAAANAPAPPSEQAVQLWLALGKAFDDLEDPAAAMAAFDAADEIRRRLCRFDAAQFESTVGRIIDRFDAATVAECSGRGADAATSIVILGMPRSGTTLVEQVLTSHRDVAGAGEMLFWNRRGQMAMSPSRKRLDGDFLRGCGEDHAALLSKRFPGTQKVTQKYPFDFLWAGLVHLALPNAAIIHTRRRPIDTAVSIHQTFFNPRLPMPTGGEDLVRCYRAYERLMAHWRRVLPPERFLEMDYEALTTEPDACVRRIVAFCGLSWDDACLRPEDNRRIVKTPSKWQVRAPINRGSVDRWRRYEPWLGPLTELVADEAAEP